MRLSHACISDTRASLRGMHLAPARISYRHPSLTGITSLTVIASLTSTSLSLAHSYWGPGAGRNWPQNFCQAFA
jgi:hypothetical protein